MASHIAFQYSIRLKMSMLTECNAKKFQDSCPFLVLKKPKQKKTKNSSTFRVLAVFISQINFATF